MKQLTFGRQTALVAAIFVLCNVLIFVTHIGWFHNLAWLAAGLLYLFHPVWPDSWNYADHARLRLGCRIAGGLMLLVALLTRFSI